MILSSLSEGVPFSLDRVGGPLRHADATPGQ